MVNTTISLPDGSRARVRLPIASDRPRVRALHARLGLPENDRDPARALRFDPRRRVVACLTTWDGGAEQLLGYGAIDFGGDDVDVLVVDTARAPGSAAALADVLRDRAAQTRAA